MKIRGRRGSSMRVGETTRRRRMGCQCQNRLQKKAILTIIEETNNVKVRRHIKDRSIWSRTALLNGRDKKSMGKRTEMTMTINMKKNQRELERKELRVDTSLIFSQHDALFMKEGKQTSERRQWKKNVNWSIRKD